MIDEAPPECERQLAASMAIFKFSQPASQPVSRWSVTSTLLLFSLDIPTLFISPAIRYVQLHHHHHYSPHACHAQIRPIPTFSSEVTVEPSHGEGVVRLQRCRPWRLQTVGRGFG